jgi:hypothetical protein
MKIRKYLPDLYGRKRILTPLQRAVHIVRCRATHGAGLSEDYFKSLGDMATINTNQFHNPETGFLEFYPDTPDWVRKLQTKTKHANQTRSIEIHHH